MARVGKALAIALAAIWAVLAIFVHWGEDEPEIETLWTAPAFELVDQDGAPFGTERLRGHVWIASFLFTRCGMSCPTLAAQLANLETRLAPHGDRVRIVSLSVDPEHDTPADLRAFGERFGADFARWTFLTGEPAVVHDVHERVFFQPAAEHADIDVAPGFDILHGTSVLLFDTELRCRGTYGLSRVEQDQLVTDVGHLLEFAPAESSTAFGSAE